MTATDPATRPPGTSCSPTSTKHCAPRSARSWTGDRAARGRVEEHTFPDSIVRRMASSLPRPVRAGEYGARAATTSATWCCRGDRPGRQRRFLMGLSVHTDMSCRRSWSSHRAQKRRWVTPGWPASRSTRWASPSGRRVRRGRIRTGVRQDGGWLINDPNVHHQRPPRSMILLVTKTDPGAGHHGSPCSWCRWTRPGGSRAEAAQDGMHASDTASVLHRLWWTTRVLAPARLRAIMWSCRPSADRASGCLAYAHTRRQDAPYARDAYLRRRATPASAQVRRHATQLRAARALIYQTARAYAAASTRAEIS